MLKGKIIIVDPGHGGKDSGAVGGKNLEKNINLRIALRVGRFLSQLGATVFMTRNTDATVSLGSRVALADNKKADAFISIHCNAATTDKAKGIEVLYFGRSSRQFAQTVQDSLVKYLQRDDRGIVQRDNVFVLKQRRLSILAEVGFISNPEEEKLLSSDAYQLKAAQAITRGVVKYFEGH